MNKVQPKTLSGFMELLPNEQILFNQEFNVIDANSIPTYEKNKTIDEILGQTDLLGENGIIRQMVNNGNLSNFNNEEVNSIIKEIVCCIYNGMEFL